MRLNAPGMNAVAHFFLSAIIPLGIFSADLATVPQDPEEIAAAKHPTQFLKPEEFKVFSITHYGRSVQLTMPKQGIRYELQLNGRDLGISQYGQVLVLAENDHLKLIEKHTSLYVSPYFTHLTAGLSVILVEHLPGEEKKISNISIELD